MSDLSNEKRNPGCLGYKKGDEVLSSYNIWIYIYIWGLYILSAPILSACNFLEWVQRVPKHRASQEIWSITGYDGIPNEFEYNVSFGPFCVFKLDLNTLYPWTTCDIGRAIRVAGYDSIFLLYMRS